MPQNKPLSTQIMNVRIFLQTCPLVVLTLLYGVAACAQPHWPQFRGPNGLGISTSAQPPVQFGPDQNVLWKSATPAGYSSPCVWGDRVFLTGVDGNNLVTLAFDRSNGKELWCKEVAVEKLEAHYKTSSPVTATPTADGERVYAYFGSFGLIAYRLWTRWPGGLAQTDPHTEEQIRHVGFAHSAQGCADSTD